MEYKLFNQNDQWIRHYGFPIIDMGPKTEDANTWDGHNVVSIKKCGHVAFRNGIGNIYKDAIQYALIPVLIWKQSLLGQEC